MYFMLGMLEKTLIFSGKNIWEKEETNNISTK